mgnify:CR=1 FL=1
MENNELYHYGVMGMKWGHRKAYKTAVSNAKLAYKNRNSSIQKRYDIEEANIEKNYRRGQALSNKDYDREIAASNRAERDWAKSKATYKDDIRRAKNDYKANVAKTKAEYKNNYKQLKNNDSAADKLLFNTATRKKAAQYMTENKMSMTEARKKAHKEAIRNTAVSLAVIGGMSLAQFATERLRKE